MKEDVLQIGMMTILKVEKIHINEALLRIMAVKINKNHLLSKFKTLNKK